MRAYRKVCRIGVAVVATVVGSSCAGGAATVADKAADRDIAVLTRLLQDQCAEAKEKYRIVSDDPAAIETSGALTGSKWPDASALAEEIKRRSTDEHWRWPHVSVCTSARITDATAIEAAFARDQRVPRGWDYFYAAYPGADGLIKYSRPAFASDGLTAVVYMESSCDVGCATGLFVKLDLTKTGWQITGREVAWTP